MPDGRGRTDPSPDALVERFSAVLERFPELQQRKMFGFPAAFAESGHMVTGLHRSDWVIRGAADDLETLSDLGGRTFEPMPGRPMSGFLRLPNDIIDDDVALMDRIARAQAFVATLPPKKKRKRRG